MDILVENMGRVNYGHKVLSRYATKGNSDRGFVGFALLTKLETLSTSSKTILRKLIFKGWAEGQPAFYAYDFTVQEPKDTYLGLV